MQTNKTTVVQIPKSVTLASILDFADANNCRVMRRQNGDIVLTARPTTVRPTLTLVNDVPAYMHQ